MFSNGTSTFTQRALAAAGMLRSFLLLEDDRSVDWEVDQDGETREVQVRRAPLHERRLKPRRPGESPARPHVCLAPVEATSVRHELGVSSHARSRGSVAREYDGRPPCRRSSSL
jgi:hypothetical protein